MAQQTINVGAAPNDGTGTPLRTAFQYTNSNFSELYTAVGPSGNNIVVPGTATITGDLTVGTGAFGAGQSGGLIGNGKQVVFTNNSGSNSGWISNADNACIYSSGAGGAFAFNGHLVLQPRGSAAGAILFGTGNGAAAMAERYKIDSTGVSTWSNVGGVASTAMTLNATGLGVGGSPTSKLTIGTGSFSAAASGTTGMYTTASGLEMLSDSYFFGSRSGGGLMTLNSSGNVGIGVTPSAWGAGAKMIDLGVGSAIGNAGSTTTTWFSSNSYQNGTNWIYKNSAAASYYAQLAGQHQWYTAPSGTAGASAAVTSGQSYTVSVLGSSTLAQWQAFFSALTVLPTVGQVIAATATGSIVGGGTVTQNITFTQAMTLDANGQLLLGTATTSGVVDTAMVMDKSSGSGFVGNVYRMGGADKGYSYLSSASASMLYETVTGYVIRMVSATNGVYLANGGTSWLTISDERNKDIIEPISNAVAKVGSLRSVIGKFKSETEGTRRSFLIAQDVQAVLPEAVDSTNPNELAVSYTDVIPLLVAAIKELTARVQTLEAK